MKAETRHSTVTVAGKSRHVNWVHVHVRDVTEDLPA